MMKKYSITLLTVLLFNGCSEDAPVYYSYPDFEVLTIGSTFAELIISPDDNYLAATDKNNNQVRIIDISGEMTLVKNIWVGSKPTSMDFSGSGDTLFVGLEGSSKIALIDMNSLEVINYFQTDMDNPFDIAVVPGNRMVVSYMSSNPSLNRTKLYQWSMAGDTVLFEPLSIPPYNFIDYIDLAGPLKVVREKIMRVNVVNMGPLLDEGPLTVVEDNIMPGEYLLYLMDKYQGTPIGVHKFQIDSLGLWDQGNVSSSHIADNVSLHDIEYVPNYGVVAALGGNDDATQDPLEHAFVFDEYTLSLEAVLDVKSAPIALTCNITGESVFVSPTEADDVGTFIVEFRTDTHLQVNYYLTAGNLAANCLIVDAEGKYIYAAVDDHSDNNSFEPYNDNTYNIQRIEIVPWGTYPINEY